MKFSFFFSFSTSKCLPVPVFGRKSVMQTSASRHFISHCRLTLTPPANSLSLSHLARQPDTGALYSPAGAQQALLAVPATLTTCWHAKIEQRFTCFFLSVYCSIAWLLLHIRILQAYMDEEISEGTSTLDDEWFVCPCLLQNCQRLRAQYRRLGCKMASERPCAIGFAIFMSGTSAQRGELDKYGKQKWIACALSHVWAESAGKRHRIAIVSSALPNRRCFIIYWQLRNVLLAVMRCLCVCIISRKLYFFP